MDWTGGTRRRFASKGKPNAVLQKQKEHFAKVRTAQNAQLDLPDVSSSALASRQHRPTMVPSQPMRTNRPTSSKASKSSGKATSHGSKTMSSRRGKHARPAVDMTDEERLLLANRQRLLARSDWLGLAASRPARMRFPSTSERDKVGKRRKIHKSGSKSHRAKVARPRSVTPLQEHRLPPFEPMMSGAMMDEDIQVKIGTDAFVSQSQFSQPAQPSANTSMRQPSTDFGPLSEESMLLDVDENGFEIDANGQHVGVFGSVGRLVDEFEPQRPPSDSRSVDGFAIPTASIAPTFATTNNGRDACDQKDYVQRTRLSPVQQPHDDTGNSDTDYYLDHMREHKVRNVHTVERATVQSEDEQQILSHAADHEEDERIWRRAMRIPEAVSAGNSSLAALGSWSGHVTESAASYWPLSRDPEDDERHGHGQVLDDPTNARNLDADTQQDFKAPVTQPISHRHESARTVPIAATLKQTSIKNTAHESQVRDDEALWKDFILGKRGSDSDTSEPEQNVWAAEQEEAVQRAFQSTPSRLCTDPARSDKVTLGDSATAPLQISDDDESSDAGSIDGENQGQTTTSMVGHANTANFEEDEIDDLYPDDSVSRVVGNIHSAGTVAVLNPRRFRRQKTEESRPKADNPHRFKVRTTERSVW